MTRTRVRLGRIYADALAFDEAIEAIVERAASGRGGYVVTPNVDHVCLAEESAELVDAYDRAFLSLVDGKPLLWLARALGHPFPAKISGSDLAAPLVGRAAARGLKVFFLGAKDGVGARAAKRLGELHPALDVAGVVSPPLGFEHDAAYLDALFAQIAQSGARIVLVALGCPKQELFMWRERARFGPAVAIGVGGTFDFLAGEVRRAPRILSELGFEWTWRLAQEPRRMYDRYLVRDRAIVGIALRQLAAPRAAQAFTVDDS